jgi:hypothetical protein
MIYTRFYDQVLTEIEAGKVHDGINLLVGMLDTVDLQAGSLARARSELRGHSLSRMLLEDPVVAHADAQPDHPAERLRMIGQKSPGADVSSTGRRLFEVTRELTFARALRDRRDSFDLKLSRGWRDGRSICLIDDDSTDLLSGLNGANISNITVIDLKDVPHAFAGGAEKCSDFDLILAPNLLDQLNQSELVNILGSIRAGLSEHGTVVLAGLTPQHLGAGWRSACLNWNPHCYDERALAQIASNAGLSTRMYRDETDCIIWAELKNASNAGANGETSHAG